MIRPKSLFRVFVASLDAAAGFALVGVSFAIGGSPALALLGLLYVLLGGRVFAFLKLRAFLAIAGGLSAATAYAAVFAELPLREAAPLVAFLAALFALNLVYAVRPGASRL